MGRGYLVPNGAEDLVAFDCFYIDREAVYTGDNEYDDWSRFVEYCTEQLIIAVPSFHPVMTWTAHKTGQKRFVLVQNRYVDVTADEADDYVAVFVVIPEDCESPGQVKRTFSHYTEQLESVLKTKYPGRVTHRINSREAQRV